MTRLMFARLFLFVLTMGAGVVTGLLIARLPGHASLDTAADREGTSDRSALVVELQLTPAQRVQMRTIWQGVQSSVQECFERGRDLQRQRDEAIVRILNDDQKPKFENIARTYKADFDQLVVDRRQAFDSAVSRTKSILDEKQRRKYEEIIRDRVGTAGSAEAGPLGSEPAGAAEDRKIAAP